MQTEQPETQKPKLLNNDILISEEVACVYGKCPQCGERGVCRERRLNGNDTCKNGHVYPSRKAVQQF